jgi:hypothetical protein
VKLEVFPPNGAHLHQRVALTAGLGKSVENLGNARGSTITKREAVAYEENSILRASAKRAEHRKKDEAQNSHVR